MKKKNSTRNLNIDWIRGIAILMVVIYHITVVGNIKFKSEIINTLISAGGDLGVTIFFILSGYSIYKVLANHKGTYLEYLKKRLAKLSPHYYISLAVALLLTPAAVYLSKDHIFNIVSHIFYFHNLFISFHGAISGVCWTLGVIFQFYIIAPLLNKILNKYPKITLTASIIITILCKGILYYIILPSNDSLNAIYYFIYGRQLITALDAFMIGMFISKYESKNKCNNFIKYVELILLFAMIVLLLLYGYNYNGLSNVLIYSQSLKGVFFFSLLSILIGLFIYVFSSLKIKMNIVINQMVLSISKHEYAIYIWHLLILNSLLQYSSFFQELVNSHPVVSTSVFLIVLTLISCLIDIIISSINFKNLNNIIEKNSKKIIYLFLIIIIIFVLKATISNVQMTYKNHKNKNKNINQCIGSCLIYKNVKDKLDCKNEQCKYIYIDTEETGYLYFYQLRYYLSPNIIDHYNNYVNIINNGVEEELYNYLKDLDVDYVIVRDNELLNNTGYELDKINGKLYKINHDSQQLSDVLLEVQ